MTTVLERIARELERDRGADAYLFVGRSRRGLRRCAEDAAGLLLGARGPAREHPDCAVFDPDELGTLGLKVEHVAERKEGVASVEGALRFRPVAGERRCLLLFEADRMGPDAQAALLKTAEEPPPGTVLLLTAGDLSPLLPALRSRCRTYRVTAPPAAEIDRRAAAAGLEEPGWTLLCQACGGPEAALALEPGEREALLALHPAFARWAAGETAEGAWLAPPEGSNLAEQRRDGEQRLGAALGWLAGMYADSDPDQALRLDRAARALVEALGELRGQVSPAVLFEDLAEILLERD